MTNVENQASLRTLPQVAANALPGSPGSAARNYRASPLCARDGVTTMCLPGPGFGGMTGSPNPIAQLLQQLLGIVSQLIGAISGLFGGNTGAEMYFANADGASVGDPHCSFTGSTANGTQSWHFDSMTPHEHLLDSDSFFGGFRVSTQTTAPGANGVTYNSRASVTTNFGATQVWLDKDGHAGIHSSGQFTALQNGQTVNVGNGEIVSRAADGTLTVTQTNANGGSVTTTMKSNGQGVDVTAHGQNVDLGGDLVAANSRPEVWQLQ